MKVGMNLLLWTGAVTEEHFGLLEDIKKWGFDGVEIPIFAADASPWDKLAAKLDELGLGRTAVGVLPEGANLIGETAGERKAAVDFLKSIVDVCNDIGVETLAGPIYSPVGQLVGRGPNDDERARAVEGLKELGTHAAAAGVPVAVEPLNRFETYFLNSQQQSADLLAKVGNDSIGVMYDTFHANIEEKDLTEAVKTSKPFLKHVHISANDRSTPGDDHIDYDTTFAALKSVGYDGWLTIEAFGGWLPELAGATCIWRDMAPSAEHIAVEGLKMIKAKWNG